MASGSRKQLLLTDTDPAAFRRDALLHAPADYFVLLDNADQAGSFQWLMACGKSDELLLSVSDNIRVELDNWLARHPDWRFGFISYDLKNVLEPGLSSKTEDVCEVPLLHFFVPEAVFISDGKAVSAMLMPDYILPDWGKEGVERESHPVALPAFQPLLSQEEYIRRVRALQGHILRGDIYEINFCTEWRSGSGLEFGNEVYYHQQQRMRAPASVFLRLGVAELLCHSPERFLRKTGSKLLTQPIKGTAPRSADPKKDQQNLEGLSAEKEQSENVMIVDLVRNDLSKIAMPGSVRVEELFGKYTFPQVHQMISSVSCQLRADASFYDILEALFPMGSMTGAPKISAMQLAERYEPMSRGLYSGSVGYFNPEGDFDFNVVIRSILHSRSSNRAVIRAGSAITWEADAAQEWEECIWKISGLQQS
jgi:para-aminobenzoate synthetase component I